MTPLPPLVLSQKRQEILNAQRRYPLSLLEALIEGAPPVESFYVALGAGGGRPKIIADLGRRQAVDDVPDPRFEPSAWGHHMQTRGAVAFVVATDPTVHGGKSEDLKTLRREFELPLLRRDFIIDEYQIYESRAFGADSFTLHVALHDVPSLQYHLEVGRELAMEPVIMVSSLGELEQALATDAFIVSAMLTEENIGTLLAPLRRALQKDRKLCGVLDASRVKFRRIQQLGLEDFHGVIYSQKSLGYEQSASTPKPSNRINLPKE